MGKFSTALPDRACGNLIALKSIAQGDSANGSTSFVKE